MAKAKPFLMKDFSDRCAYSMQHWRVGGGQRCMEIDHFDPRRKSDAEQNYENLFLVHRHCNGAKRDIWPSDSDLRQGIRFLNCCQEWDYGVHIFEDLANGEVLGETRAGKFHIVACDLNAPHLMEERRERTKKLRNRDRIMTALRDSASRMSDSENCDLRTLTKEALLRMQADLATLIPRIPRASASLRKSSGLYSSKDL